MNRPARSALLGVVWLTACVPLLSRAPEPWHLSGDDAMGVGIDFLLLCGIAAACLVVLLVSFWLGRVHSPSEHP